MPRHAESHGRVAELVRRAAMPPTPCDLFPPQTLLNRLLFVSIVCAAVILVPAPVSSDTYRLDVQDKLRIKIVEWRAGTGEYQEWTALSAEYTVNAAGALSLPLIGDIPAANKTTAEVADAISESLKKRAGLISRPHASLEVVQYRPTYILGDVERPGEYPYRPGMTVLQAVGVAGGFYRPNEGGLLRLERDRIASTGNYESARLELRRMLARRGRLEAELAGAAGLVVPEELLNDPAASNLLNEERSVMFARSDALKKQLSAIDELKTLYAQEIESLQNKGAMQEKQIALARRELKTVSALVEKGLVVSSREFALERLLADTEGRMLDIETALLRAKQELRKAERDHVDLIDDRKAKTASELRETTASIEQITARLHVSRLLVNEAAVTAPHLALERATGAQTRTFSIVRKVDGDVLRLVAHETTAVNPGDVVRVDTTFSDTAANGANAAQSTVRDPKDPDVAATSLADHVN